MQKQQWIIRNKLTIIIYVLMIYIFIIYGFVDSIEKILKYYIQNVILYEV